MKHIMKKTLLFAALATALMACGGQADAATSTVYVAGSNAVYNLDFSNTWSISNANELAVVQTLPGWSNFVQVGTGTTWINVSLTQYIGCSSGTLSVTFPATTQQFSDPGCATFNKIKAAAAPYN